jgi:hypothetical protein
MEHDLRANAPAFVATENRCTLLRIMLQTGAPQSSRHIAGFEFDQALSLMAA